ncbi:MAG: NADH:ubiquinone oxidoreductase subunit NDUFA12 [Rhodospirillaceae bacterium]|nr:NADH:ubiquinone oxidoreductase subunit NDUFA12 [Rhodospirillaceae bacterium]
MDVGTHLYTWLWGRQVGGDQFGNRYFEHKYRTVASGKLKRWVLYNGIVEASKVPPEWHAWLHYNLESVPDLSEALGFEWQKPHLPNLTGTRYSYRPPGHLSQGGTRDGATGDYEPWKPN